MGGIIAKEENLTMNRMVVNSRVGSDGVLHVSVPVGPADADRQVRVTIEPADEAPAGSVEYRDWLRDVAGKWQGDFERPLQGSAEEREPLS
jgi:hypothetical protein